MGLEGVGGRYFKVEFNWVWLVLLDGSDFLIGDLRCDLFFFECLYVIRFLSLSNLHLKLIMLHLLILLSLSDKVIGIIYEMV